MKVLVTGASGFVGGHLCRSLVSAGHDVKAVVRKPITSMQFGEQIVVPDIGRQTDWHGIVDDCDVVIHLAARVHVMNDTSDDPLEAFRAVNTYGTETLARASAAAKVKRFVFLSSIKVNGEATNATPFRVVDQPNPVDPYGISKLEAEVSIKAIGRELDMPVTVVRTPLVYGPGVGGNFRRFLWLADTRIIPPFASIKNQRTMCGIANLVDVLQRAASESMPASVLIFAGDNVSLSTPELYKAIAQAMGRRSTVLMLPVFLLSLMGRLAGKASAVERLVGSLKVEPGADWSGWDATPVMTLESGIAETVNWYLQQKDQPRR